MSLIELLDPEQRRVLTELVDGASLSSIARTMELSEPQIEAIKRDILRTFGVCTTADLIRIGLYAGLGGAV